MPRDQAGVSFAKFDEVAIDGGVLYSSEDEIFPSSAEETVAADVVDETGSEIFFSSDAEGEEHVRKRARYNSRNTARVSFLGRPVCRRALERLLQVGGSSLERLRKGEACFTNKDRLPLAKHPTFHFTLRGEVAALWEDIVMFLWHMYQTASETLPTHWKSLRETPFEDDGLDPQDERDRLVNSIAQTLSTTSSDINHVLVGPGTFAGSRRCVMHCTRADLYWEYSAYAEARGLRVASQSTFYRVANGCIKPGLRNGHLRFRKPSEHATCDDCFRLREAVRQTKDPAAKIEAQKAFHRHQLQQWLDRQVYWSFRSMSQTWFQNMMEENARRDVWP